MRWRSSAQKPRRRRRATDRRETRPSERWSSRRPRALFQTRSWLLGLLVVLAGLVPLDRAAHPVEAGHPDDEARHGGDEDLIRGHRSSFRVRSIQMPTPMGPMLIRITG